MKTILVTGGAGFIGTNFVYFMLDKYPDYNIINLDKLTYAGNRDNLATLDSDPRHEFVHGDVADKDLVLPLMERADAVVHFAAETHVDRSIMFAGDFVKTDVFGTYVLLEAALKCGVERFVHISTDEVYGDAGEQPSKETDALMPRSPYAASKAGADRLAFSYWATHNVPVVITRCSNNLGPYQYPEKLIPLFVTNAIDDIPLPVYGNGKNTRDWIFVNDHASAVDTVLHTKGHDGEAFNVGANTEYDILDITKFILDYLKKPESLVKFVKDRAGHVKRHAVNTEKTEAALGWKAATPFEDAMAQTVQWYVDNEAWWRKIKEKQEDYKKFMQEYYKDR